MSANMEMVLKYIIALAGILKRPTSPKLRLTLSSITFPVCLVKLESYFKALAKFLGNPETQSIKCSFAIIR